MNVYDRAEKLAKELNLPNRRRAILNLQRLKETGAELTWDFLKDLLALLSASQFLSDFLIKHPKLLNELSRTYKRSFSPSEFYVKVVDDEKEFKDSIRVYRNLQMSRVVLRDLLGLADFTELTRDTTLIHDAILQASLEFAERHMRKRYGRPSEEGFCIVDMGKAGGFELNYSSDVDVIYVYYSRFGKTTGGTFGKLTNHEFYTLLSDKITKLITERTKEGVCFNLDLRLRPNGTLGPLCNDLMALEDYYTAIARPWERLALLKARPSAGDLKKTGLEFEKLITPFVYRRYVDLNLIDEILRIKEKIRAKVSKKGRKIDLKLGEGGIREIEFIVQAFQTIYGGKNPQIRSRNTLFALDKLRSWGFLTHREHQDLKKAYLFLRRSEHMLQITYFRQTQTFHPESEEAQELAIKMGFNDRREYLDRLNAHMSRVSELFNRFFPVQSKVLSSFSIEALERKGFKEPQELKRFIDLLLEGNILSETERRKLDLLGEQFLKLIYEMPDSKLCMKNLVNFLSNEQGKVFFFSIIDHVNALRILLMLLATKEDFFLKRFYESPEILDYLLDPDGIEKNRSKKSVEATFEFFGDDKSAKNLEEIRVVLRYLLKRSSVYEYLREMTQVADVVVRRTYAKMSPRFCVASLGKHGSYELNVGSDLDMLFALKRKDEVETERAVKFIKRLESLGYEVDTRLRPFGEKGQLCFTLDYFSEYLKKTARLWERLAFTRFRVIQGDFADEFRKVVDDFVFKKPLDEKELKGIIEMRKRLETELSKKNDLKYEPGGVVDLEFAAYTYQIYKRRRLLNTKDVLCLIREEGFENVCRLYDQIKELETQKRLYGKIFKEPDDLRSVKAQVREFFERFMTWMKRNI